MKLTNLCRAALIALAASTLLSVAGQAAPITMITSGGSDTATLNGVIGSFDLSLQSGDTATNTLVFRIEGNPPAVGVAAIVFDGATILSASELSDPDNLLTGFGAPGTHLAAGVLFDFSGKPPAVFQIALDSAPTTATLYSLNLKGTSTLYRSTSWRKLAIETVGVRFSSAAIPEPAAALCFAAGLALVASRLRRR